MYGGRAPVLIGYRGFGVWEVTFFHFLFPEKGRSSFHFCFETIKLIR